MDELRTHLQENFLLRWTLANLLGWTVGLYLGTLAINSPIICLLGLLTGVSIGLAQWWALRNEVTVTRRWVIASVAGVAGGGILAAPALFFALSSQTLGLTFAGAMIGLGIGVLQWSSLPEGLKRGGWWIGANLLAGALCALLTSIPIIRGLPLGLLAGTALYGYLTGRVLRWLQLKSDELEAENVE